MKKLGLIVFILISISVQAQEDNHKAIIDTIQEIQKPKIITAREVDIMAIYPRCERDRDYRKAQKENDDLTKRESLMKCMSRKLGEQVLENLNDSLIENYTKVNNLIMLKTRINFVINTNGDITNIKSSSKGNKFIGQQGENAINIIAEEIKLGRKIKPARFSDGKLVNLSFSLPITYHCNECAKTKPKENSQP